MGVAYSHLTKEEMERNREFNEGRAARKAEGTREDIEDTLEGCSSCDQQGINSHLEHCIEHHDLAQGTIYDKCIEGCNEI